MEHAAARPRSGRLQGFSSDRYPRERIPVCAPLSARIAAATLVAAALGTLISVGSLASPSAVAAPRTILDVGDSLSIGTDPYLRPRLRGYRIERVYDVGLHAYDAAAIVARTRAALRSLLVVSAGTNDDPRMVSSFARAISGILAAGGPTRCVVWPTIARPPAVGATYDGFNRALERAAARHRNLVLVDWVGMVRRHPRWLSADGVHVSVAGYRARAAAIAGALETRCAS